MAKYDEIKNHMGFILRQLRNEKKWSTVKASMELDISESALKKYESGERGIPLKLVPSICDKYECDIDYLFGHNQSTKRKADTDIEAEIGLTDNAIAKLRECNKYHSFSIIDPLNWALENKFFFNVLDAIANYRIHLMNLSKPDLPQDIIDFAADVFTEIDVEPEENMDIADDAYLEQLLQSINTIDSKTIKKWMSIDYIGLISNEYENPTDIVKEIANSIHADIKSTRQQLAIQIYLLTHEYFFSLKVIQRDREMVIPFRLSRLIDTYFDGSFKAIKKDISLLNRW